MEIVFVCDANIFGEKWMNMWINEKIQLTVADGDVVIVNLCKHKGNKNQ